MSILYNYFLLCHTFVAVLMESSSDDTSAISNGNVSRFVEESDFTYEDFSRRSEKTISTFRASDFSWDDYGFSLGNGLYTDIGSLLDDKFTVGQNLTYNTLVSAYFISLMFKQCCCCKNVLKCCI